ncbi:MAG: DUF1559 domain-containing protein [Rhodopirellula sp. JB044]|uniref:DUF1559 family PulG-like putative transporter n=1 Tax=Rhodopirellula sp. JB044 TaxID=3342844 RepID=UPI00370B88B5
MKSNRSGFTLVELLVVITIIGILMGLLIPAVNAAREAARRNQCSTQLKNFALAAVQHENAKGELPGWLNDFGTFATGTDPSAETAATVTGHRKIGTWAVSLMPWLDAQPTYEQWTEDRYPVITGSSAGSYEWNVNAAPNIAIFQCPSNPNADDDAGRNSYISNNGTPFIPAASSSTTPQLTFADSQDRANGAFNNKYPALEGYTPGKAVRLDDFKDGQGNTMLFSENVQARGWHLPGFEDAETMIPTGTNVEIAYPENSRYFQGMVWHYEDPNYGTAPGSGWNHLSTAAAVTPGDVDPLHKINGGGTATGQDIFTLQMNSGNAEDLARPSSAHVDGVNAGMADGGTRFIAESIDYRVYQALLTPRGKSSNVPWTEFVLDDEAF